MLADMADEEGDEAALDGARSAAHRAQPPQTRKQVQRIPVSAYDGARCSSSWTLTNAAEMATHSPMQIPTVARAMFTWARPCSICRRLRRDSIHSRLPE